MRRREQAAKHHLRSPRRAGKGWVHNPGEASLLLEGLLGGGLDVTGHLNQRQVLVFRQ